MPLTRKELIKKNKVIGITNTLIFIIVSIVMFNVKWLSQTIVWTCVVQVMLLFNKYKRDRGNKMKLKKYLGPFLLMLSVVVANAGNASIAAIGVEEIPESIKKYR